MRRARSVGSLTSYNDVDHWCRWLCTCLSRQPRAKGPQRLSVYPTVSKTTNRKKSVKAVFLTGQQRLIVMRTWHKLSVDISSLGINAMTYLIDRNPDIAMLFSFDRPATELHLDSKFRQHAFWLIQAISAIVENIDDLDLMVSDMFFEIGEKHAAIPSFSQDFFMKLPAAWAFVWEDQLRERFTTQTDKSWDRIFQYVVDQLVDGLSEHLVMDEIAGYISLTASTSMTSIEPESTSSYNVQEDDSDSDSDETSTNIGTPPRQGSIRGGLLGRYPLRPPRLALQAKPQVLVEGSSRMPLERGKSNNQGGDETSFNLSPWISSRRQKNSQRNSSIGTASTADTSTSSWQKGSFRKTSVPTSTEQPAGDSKAGPSGMGNTRRIISEPLPGSDEIKVSSPSPREQPPPTE